MGSTHDIQRHFRHPELVDLFTLRPLPPPVPLLHRLGLLVAAALLGLAAVAASASSAVAAPALSPSVVGEPPQGAGVFRFPQAVTLTSGGGVVYVGDQYSGVVQAFGPDGTVRFTIGSRATRREPGRLGVVGGVATDRAGHLYVLDSENERVQVFSATDGRFITQFGDNTIFNLVGGDPATGAGISASGIAVSQATPATSPIVYVADQGHNRIARFVLDPSTLQAPAGPQFSNSSLGLAAPQGLALDPAGTRLYVADDDNHRVLVLDPQSLALLTQVGSFGTGPGQFQNPYDVAVDSHDPQQLYVADNLNNRVDVFDAASLGFLATFGQPGYGPGLGNFEIVRSVGAVADVPGGGVIATDTANNRVQAFDAAGNVTAAWGLAGRGAGYVTRPRGVAFAPDGSVSVADAFDQRVAIFAADGTYAGQRGLISQTTGYAFAGSNPGQYSLPSGVAHDAAGDLWVADTGNNRVVELDPTGNVLQTSAAGTVTRPLAVATSAAGTYVTDTGGGELRLLGAGGSFTTVRSGLSNPAAVAVAPAGDPYVADDTSVRNATTGTLVAGPEAGTTWDHPAGLAFAPDGTLYVAERRPGTLNGARVVRGTPSGAGFTWDTIASEGPGSGQVIEPAGLAVSGDGGTLLVADTGNNRVLRFDGPDRTPPPTATLNVAIAQPARGTVISDLPGISCVTDCRQSYGTARSVTLTARAAAGSVFSGWTGACASSGATPTCTVATSADQTATAAFAAAPVAPVPPVAAPPPPPPVRITGVRLSPNRLHRARRADRRRHRPAQRQTRARGTVTLTVPATLTLSVQRGLPGRRQGSSCRAPTRANRRRARCTRYVTLPQRRTIRAAATMARFTFTPTFAGRPLRPGRYRLAVSALDPNGNRVGPVTTAFRVTR